LVACLEKARALTVERTRWEVDGRLIGGRPLVYLVGNLVVQLVGMRDARCWRRDRRRQACRCRGIVRWRGELRRRGFPRLDGFALGR
jgi:hypothetical protein